MKSWFDLVLYTFRGRIRHRGDAIIFPFILLSSLVRFGKWVALLLAFLHSKVPVDVSRMYPPWPHILLCRQRCLCSQDDPWKWFEYRPWNHICRVVRPCEKVAEFASWNVAIKIFVLRILAADNFSHTFSLFLSFRQRCKKCANAIQYFVYSFAINLIPALPAD